MINLTVAVEDSVLEKVLSRAREQGTSVNDIIREYLESYSGVREMHKKAAKDITDLSEKAISWRGDKQWTRDELHER